MARSKSKYPVELDPLWREAYGAGMGPKAIYKATCDGSLPGLDGAIAMPEATFWTRWRKVRDSVKELAPLEPGATTTEERNEALLRAMVGSLERDARRILADQRKGPLPTSAQDARGRIIKQALDVRKALAEPRVSTRRKEGQGKRAAEAKHGNELGTEDATRIHLREMAMREAASVDPSSPVNGNGDNAEAGSESLRRSGTQDADSATHVQEGPPTQREQTTPRAGHEGEEGEAGQGAEPIPPTRVPA